MPTTNSQSLHRQSTMASNFRIPSSLNQRDLDSARLTRTSTGNREATCITFPVERGTHPNATSSTPSSVRVESARIPSQWLPERPPPQYDEIYPPTSPWKSRTQVKPHLLPPKDMDPLVAAMWHNENLSLLHSLPKHLLLKIIGMLSNNGVECIRRVARKFPPLCVREILSPVRGSNPRLSETGPLNWPRFGTTSFHRPQFLELVDRDEYCGGCQAARKSEHWDQRLRQLTAYIHCSACGADHPACLFSATQRLKPARLRYCIAHEGYMRICDHDDGIVRLPSLLNLKCGQPRYPRNLGFTIQQCKDPSHEIPCKRISGGHFPKTRRNCGSRKDICHGNRWPKIVACEANPEMFDLRWTAHIPFDGEMDTIRRGLAAIGTNAGQYIVPSPSGATGGPELRCFDPNDCQCITYSGSENVRWEWERGPWLPGTTQCINNHYKGLNVLLPPRPSGSIISNVIRSLRSKKMPECKADSKYHQSRLEPSPPKYGPGRCAVDVRPCHTGKDCLVVDYIRAVWVHQNGRITSQWYNTIDSRSYNITDDEDGLGVYWCSQPRCRNYYKRLPNYAGILRHREFRRECQHNDCH